MLPHDEFELYPLAEPQKCHCVFLSTNCQEAQGGQLAITGDVNFDHLVKVMSASLHADKFPLFPLLY